MDKNNLLALSVERFYGGILQLMVPKTLLGIMNRLGGQTLQQRYASANIMLLDIVNSYIRSRISVGKVDKQAKDLFVLYNLFRHKTLGVNSVVYEAAFYSNYLGALAAFQFQLYNTAAFMLSQAEKIQQKFNVGGDVKDVKLRKLLSVFGYSRAEQIKDKVKQID